MFSLFGTVVFTVLYFSKERNLVFSNALQNNSDYYLLSDYLLYTIYQPMNNKIHSHNILVYIEVKSSSLHCSQLDVEENRN